MVFFIEINCLIDSSIQITKSNKITPISERISTSSTAFTKKRISYEDISNFEELHITEKPNKETTTESLKWVHITISNVMGNLLVNY